MAVAEVIPYTDCGISLVDAVTFPSWPYVPEPQHLTAPLFKSAHTWLFPASIALTSEIAGIFVGVYESSPQVHAIPSVLFPQHAMLLSLLRAHVKSFPVTIWDALLRL